MTNQTFNEAEWKILENFYQRLRAIYSHSKYKATFPSKHEANASVTEWGKSILELSPNEISASLDHAKKMMAQGEDGWDWPDIGKIISGAKESRSAAHKLFLPTPELSPEERAKSKEIGRKAIANIRAQLK